MAAIGFRNSFLGYNKEDVINFVEKSIASGAAREKELSTQIEDLTAVLSDKDSEIKGMILQLSKLAMANNQLNDELKDLHAKQAEIERLGESIGKLYLVAQTNAKNIINNASECSHASHEEVEKNLGAVQNVQAELNILQERLTKTTDVFSSEIDEIYRSLSKTRETIEVREDEIFNASDTLNRLISTVNSEVK